MAFFIPGAGGDINPYDDKMSVTENAYGHRTENRRVGRGCGAERYGDETSQVTEDRFARFSRDLRLFADRFDPAARVPTEVTRIMFNNDVGVLAMPGEPFVRFQMNLRDQSPLAYTFLFGYAYGGEGKWTGYIPTMEAAMQGGYGADYQTHVAVGAGENHGGSRRHLVLRAARKASGCSG